MTIIGAICQRVPGSAASASEPGGGGTPTGDGENQLLNSKLSGSESDEADNWGTRFPGEGTVAFAASAVEGHRKVRFTATGPSDRAAIDQDLNVEIGQVYTISCYVVAVDEAATNPSTVILSHAPYGRATIINGTARPTVSSVGPGEWHSYTVEIVSAGTLTIVVGCDNAGDVTVERIMVDADEDLRTYDATDPTEAPDPVSGLEFLPHHGYGCGSSCAFGDGQFPLRINSNFVGWGIGIPAGIPSTAVDYFFTQLRSNRGPAGEDNKSRVNGAYPHGAYTWDFKVNCYVSNSTFTTVGSLVWTLTDSYTNSMTSDYEGYPVRHFTPPSTWTVEGGEYYILQFENLESNPDNTYFSLNSSHAQRATSEGLALDPPRAASPSPAYGNSPIVVSGPNSSSVSPYYRGIVGGTGLKLTSGVEIGSSGQDGTSSAMRKAIYGTRIWRQRMTYPWWAQADKLWHGVWRNGTPAGNLVIKLSGPNIDEEWTRTPGNVPSWNPDTTGLPPRTVETFDLSTWEADEIYTVEISAPSATETTPYWIGSVRASAPSNQYSDEPVWEQHYPGYPAEYSENNGGSWLPIGWATEPFAVGNVWVDFAQRVAETEGALVGDATPAEWAENPFSKNSAHHRPIGANATYAAAISSQSGYVGDNVFEEWANAGIGSISGANGNQFGVPIGVQSVSDPSRTITITSGSDASTLTLNVANDFPFYDNSVGYGEATNWLKDYTLYDIYNHMRSSDGATRTALLYRTCDVRELGHALSVADTKRYGSSASGCSTAIGVMRKSEIETPGLAMRHVLHLILPRGASGHSNPQGLSKYIQVPARYADATAYMASQNLGPIPYGGHVAIPPDDLSALQAAIDATSSSAFSGSAFGNVSAYEAAAKEAMKRVATQCCHYGCIAIDGGATPQFRADAPFSGYLAQAMMVIMRQSYWWSAFKLVTNAVSGADYYITSTSGVYGGTSIGTLSTTTVGGGTALAPNSALDA